MSIHKALKMPGKVLTQKVTNTTTGETVVVETTIIPGTLNDTSQDNEEERFSWIFLFNYKVSRLA